MNEPRDIRNENGEGPHEMAPADATTPKAPGDGVAPDGRTADGAAADAGQRHRQRTTARLELTANLPRGGASRAVTAGPRALRQR